MKKLTNQQKSALAITAIALLFGGSLSAKYFYAKRNTSPVEAEALKAVKVVPIGAKTIAGSLSVEGTVKAASKVDIVAMANGTVKSLNFKVGDRVSANQPLGFVQDDALMTNYANSNLNYSNVAQNLSNTTALTEEMIRQSDLGVTRAKEMVAAAQIGVDTAKLNIENVKNLQEKGKTDLKNNSIVAVANYSNTANAGLDQIDTLYGIDGRQLDGLSGTLAAKNSQSLSQGKDSYRLARAAYLSYSLKSYAPDQADTALKDTLDILNKTKRATDDAILVLSATISSTNFSETSLSLQKTGFNQLRSNLVGSINAAQANLQALQNIELANKRELDGLNNALRAAENQLTQAKLALDNAMASLSASKQSQNQQVQLSKSSLDGARGQLNLLATQLSDLTIKAPIAGEVGSKLVEIGAEVRIGQKIGEITQANSVKIIAQLAPEDASRIKLGTEVKLSSGQTGTINNIAPSADSLTKKVQIEIIVDNKDGSLKPETLVSAQLPISNDNNGTHDFLVPLPAITISQNENFIYTAENGRAKKHAIELIEVDGETAKIRVELPGSAQLIIDGNKLLKDGSAVKINQ